MILTAVVGQGEVYKHDLDKDNRFVLLQTIIDETEDLSLLPGVDLVIIATKLETHANLIKYFLNLNKNVLCLGPLAQTTQEIDEIDKSRANKTNSVDAKSRATD